MSCVIQHSRCIIDTVNEYISGILLLTGRLYNTHQEHPQGHTLPIVIQATNKTGQLQVKYHYHHHHHHYIIISNHSLT